MPSGYIADAIIHGSIGEGGCQSPAAIVIGSIKISRGPVNTYVIRFDGAVHTAGNIGYYQAYRIIAGIGVNRRSIDAAAFGAAMPEVPLVTDNVGRIGGVGAEADGAAFTGRGRKGLKIGGAVHNFDHLCFCVLAGIVANG